METQKIMVTGGKGFIGTNLVSELKQRGHDVWVCDIGQSEGEQYVRCDVGKYRQVERRDWGGFSRSVRSVGCSGCRLRRVASLGDGGRGSGRIEGFLRSGGRGCDVLSKARSPARGRGDVVMDRDGGEQGFHMR